MKEIIDIIIVTYNAKEKLKNCLASVIKNSKSFNYTLTVVDNHSSDGTWKFLKLYGKKIRNMRLSNNKGFSYAANFAVRQTQNELIVLLDDDIEVPPRWLDKLYAPMQGARNIAIVGPKVVFPNGQIFSVDGSFKKGLSRGKGEWDKGQRDYIRECDMLTGPCWLMRRSVFKEVGFFDERFFPCRGEDTDYCLRVRRAGYKIIYNGQVRVVHHHLLRTLGLAQKNMDLYWNKWGKIISRLCFKDISMSEKHYESGINDLNQGRYPQARNNLLRAEALCPGLIGPYLLGTAYFKTKEWKQASTQFEDALKIYPFMHPFFQGALYNLSQMSVNVVQKKK